MKNNVFVLVGAALILTACGPGPLGGATAKSASSAVQSTATLPQYDSAGVIAVAGERMLTIDHEGASAAGVPAGRNEFLAYADILAEAPLAPGTRVAFKFRKAPDGLELTELKIRE